MDQREQHTAKECEYHRQIKRDRGISRKISGNAKGEKGTGKGTESLKALDGKIGNAASLTINSTDCHDKQRQGKG